MRERKLKSRLIAYYLRLADLGDEEAWVKACVLGNELFKDEPIKVIFANGDSCYFTTLEEVLSECKIDYEALFYFLETGEKDSLNRTFKRTNKKEMGEN